MNTGQALAIVLPMVAWALAAMGLIVRVVGSRIDDLAAHLRGFEQQVGTRFDAVDARFSAMDARFDRVDARLDAVSERLTSVEVTVGRIDQRVGHLEAHDEGGF